MGKAFDVCWRKNPIILFHSYKWNPYILISTEVITPLRKKIKSLHQNNQGLIGKANRQTCSNFPGGISG